jgi:hypothetical protein
VCSRAWEPGGESISGAAARRIGCDAHIIPIVLGSHSEPLDISRPTPTPAIRRATIARDGGCIGPHCDRPPAWCDLHHIQHWADGGPTTLTNLRSPGRQNPSNHDPAATAAAAVKSAVEVKATEDPSPCELNRGGAGALGQNGR